MTLGDLKNKLNRYGNVVSTGIVEIGDCSDCEDDDYDHCFPYVAFKLTSMSGKDEDTLDAWVQGEKIALGVHTFGAFAVIYPDQITADFLEEISKTYE